MFKLQGIGKPATEAVPNDLEPAPRPKGELFFKLPGGGKMPGNGIGMCCRPSAYDPISVYRSVLWHLLQGGRHIDTAAVYLNHESVGLAIRDAIARGIARDEIFLTTKIFPDSYGYQSSIDKAHRMLKELGVDYIDLVLLHVPVKFNPKVILKKILNGVIDDAEMSTFRTDTWKGLSSVKDAGLIKNLGVSNFNIKQMKEIQDLKLAPIAANQIQYHPWLPQFQKDIATYCHEQGIIITGYFSLGGFDNKDKAMEVEVLNEIAKLHQKRPAQILLRWSLQKNVSIIPGSGNHKHIEDNLATYGFSLSAEDMRRLDGMSSLPLAKDFMLMEF